MKKQLTLSKGKATAFLVVLCLSLFQACRKEVLVPDSKGIQSGLSIADAKNYFNEHMKTTVAPKKLMSTGGSGNPSDEQLLENMLAGRQPIWESAYQQLTSTGSSVKIPLDLGKVFMITDEGKKEIIPFAALNYLFMYKDSLEHIHTEWVTLFPDREWLYGNRSQYAGDIQIQTWEGTLLRQLHYDRPGSTASGHTASSRKISAIKKKSTDGPAPDIPLVNTVCISFANGSKCTCANKSNCDMCWQCTSNVCRTHLAGAVIPEINGPEFWGGGGGSNGAPGPSGGGGAYYPPDYVPPGCVDDPSYTIPTYPAPGGYEWAAPCGGPGGGIPTPIGPIISTVLENIINILGITDTDKQNFLMNNPLFYDMLSNFLVEHMTPDNREFVDWAAGFLMNNPNISAFDFENQFMPTIEVIADPDESNWTDPDNETFEDPDQTVYQPYQDNQPWPAITPVIKFEDFVPNRYLPGSSIQTVNCLKLAKEQLAKNGYTVSGYYAGSPQIYQVYTESGGVDLTKTRQAINYMIETLKKGVPVLVGVDVKAGAPAANKDNSTDHFIVIVGAGTDTNGKYFQFMDSSTNWPTLGASKNNKLYFDPVTGKITGATMSQYGTRSNRHNFILTHVRKSIRKSL